MSKIRIHPMALGPNSSEIFSAFYPLGCIVAYAKAHLDGALCDSFEFGKITPTGESSVQGILEHLPAEPGIFLLSSYVWNHAVNMSFARELKKRSPASLVILGGPHVPRMPNACAQFFESHADIDVTVRHEGEATLTDILETIGRAGVDAADLRKVSLDGVDGLTYRAGGELRRTPDRARSKDLSNYPSPYTTGEYDHWIADKRYIPLETNRGCPYGCTFCDWGAATLSKISQMPMEKVLGEIEFAAKNRIYTIGFCDANFGILPRDLDIVRYILQMKERYGYPRDVGYTNAKSAKPRLGEIVKLLRDAGLTAAAQISMQTIDDTVLQNVERANIKTSEYRKMIAFFHQEDIPAVSDMMLGLPGQTFETTKRDLQFFFDHKVLAVVFATSVMPNAPMADEAYQKKFGIELDQDGMVEATYSFSRSEYARMFELCLAYKLFVKLGVLKYLLYFVQINHGVKAMDFIARWMDKATSEPELYPISKRIKQELLGRDYRGGRKDWLVLLWKDDQAGFLFDDLGAFQREVVRFFEREHGVRLEGSDVDAVLTANREIMPRKGRELPARTLLPHDVAGYFSDLRKLPSIDELPPEHEPLGTRGSGHLELAPQASCTSYGYIDFGLTFGALELASNLRV